MNLTDLHDQSGVSAKPISALLHSKVTAIQILAGALLKEHITRIPAILICVQGEVVFEDEKGNQEQLKPGDYKAIEPMVNHWVKGVQDAQLVLIK